MLSTQLIVLNYHVYLLVKAKWGQVASPFSKPFVSEAKLKEYALQFRGPVKELLGGCNSNLQ